jgi:hypothetical protein
MEKLTNVDFALGPGGWVKTSWRRGGPERSAWVRFEPRKHGDWVIAELRVQKPTAESLREIPLYRIGLSFNALKIREELREWFEDEVPANLDEAIRAHYRNRPRQKLQRPARRRLDEDFFLEVAFTYREAAIRGLDPVQTIAEDADVPHSTAARWVGQARDKKFLPRKPRRGKVTL